MRVVNSCTFDQHNIFLEILIYLIIFESIDPFFIQMRLFIQFM